MAERNLTSSKEPWIRPDGAFTVVETTALGFATMAMIIMFEASMVGERLKLPGAKKVGNKLEHVLYTPKQIQKRRESENNNSES